MEILGGTPDQPTLAATVRRDRAMAMITIITDYQSRERDIRDIREQVFLIEQQIDRDEEFDGRDEACTHVLVYEQERPVGTGRIDLENEGKVGRISVLSECRRRGIGSLLMQALEEHAAAQGLDRIWFHAQTTAVPFYESLGYRVCGDEFLEANLTHVMMEKRLNR